VRAARPPGTLGRAWRREVVDQWLLLRVGQLGHSLEAALLLLKLLLLLLEMLNL